ncbi:MAG: PDZ domain-containing protein [Pirellulaceae bacterium]
MRHAKTTDDGIALLANLVDLRYLQNSTHAVFRRFHKTLRRIASLIRLVSAQITDDASQQLVKQLPAVEIDFWSHAGHHAYNRQPCSISMVYAGSAADKAGLRIGDDR